MSRDKFLHTKMGLDFYPANKFKIEHRPWEYFGMLWEWAIKQNWWGTFSKLHTIGSDRDNMAIWQLYIDPDRFANAIYVFLKDMDSNNKGGQLMDKQLEAFKEMCSRYFNITDEEKMKDAFVFFMIASGSAVVGTLTPNDLELAQHKIKCIKSTAL